MPIDEPFSSLKNPDLIRGIENAGLDLKSIEVHHARFQNFQSHGMKNRSFAVKDSCRLDNGRIVPYSMLKKFPRRSKNVASFIPAAGSSTRYTQAFYDLSNKGVSDKELESLLPKDPKTGKSISFTELAKIPKALYPCVKEGNTFLELKFLEQKSLQGISKTICIIPPHTEELFQLNLRNAAIENKNILFMEQGSKLSTLRFDDKGLPLEEDLSLSIAPAGHGSLLKLFPKIKEKFPEIESLFIRNIDNIIGSKEENVHITEHFLGAHHSTLESLKKIREAVDQKHLDKASIEAEHLMGQFPQRALSEKEKAFLQSLQDKDEKTLCLVLIRLFQTPLALFKTHSLKRLFDRPLNFLGQVPNSGKDSGGVPVVIDMEDGETSICLELPHFSKADQTRIQDMKFATHFNPVFASVELQPQIGNYEHDQNPYWVFAEKQWNGKTVYYHESLLYEMIGNSKFANLLFVELPRSIFNPHKTLDDGRGQTLKQWI